MRFRVNRCLNDNKVYIAVYNPDSAAKSEDDKWNFICELIEVFYLTTQNRSIVSKLRQIAWESQSVMPLLGVNAYQMRCEILILLKNYNDTWMKNENLKSRYELWTMNTDENFLPFTPTGFRDCSLYMDHMANASKRTLQENPSYLLQGLFHGLGRMLRFPKPIFDINHQFKAMPVHYHANHLNIFPNGTEIPWPCYTNKMDYELEIAVVVSSCCKDLVREEALSAIGGFVLINDFSARDVQLWEMTETGFGFPKSKNFATSLGNVVVTPDEILPTLFVKGKGLNVSVQVDGKLWSQNVSSDPSRAHDLEDMIAFATLGENIYAGEVIGMGTIPTCCGLEVKKWLKPGNVITLAVDYLGTLTNKIKERDPWPKDMQNQTCFKYLNYKKKKKKSFTNFFMSAIKILVLSIIFSLLMVSYKECPLEPTIWETPDPLIELKGDVLKVNRILTDAEHLHVNKFIGPEAIAFSEIGEIYTGLNDGRVVKMDAFGRNPIDIIFVGGIIKNINGVDNNNNGLNEIDFLESCKEKARNDILQHDPSEESQCGRPLGLKYKKSPNDDRYRLYIADAYYGIFVFEPETGNVTHLVQGHKDTPIVPGNDNDEAFVDSDISKPFRLINDLEVLDDGTILFTDTSWKNTRAEVYAEAIDGSPRGRLLKFDPAENKISTILCGLHFPNGLLLDDTNSDSLLLVESTRFRILRINDLSTLLSSPETFARTCDNRDFTDNKYVTIFAKGLPGFPDNIKYSPSKRFLYIGMGTKNTKPFSLLHFVYQFPYIREVIGRIIPLKFSQMLVPKYGLVCVLDENGRYIKLLQDPTGRTPFISDAAMHPDTKIMFLLSYKNKFLSKVSLDNADEIY